MISSTAATPLAQRSATMAVRNQIGMAPGAKWIGCRNMDEGVGTPARYIECMEFFLAPYPVGGGRGRPDQGTRHYHQLLGLPDFGRLFG